MDWSFSSPYKGKVGPLKEALELLIPTEFSLPETLRNTILAAIPEDKQIEASIRRDEASQ